MVDPTKMEEALCASKDHKVHCGWEGQVSRQLRFPHQELLWLWCCVFGVSFGNIVLAAVRQHYLCLSATEAVLQGSFSTPLEFSSWKGFWSVSLRQRKSQEHLANSLPFFASPVIGSVLFHNRHLWVVFTTQGEWNKTLGLLALRSHTMQTPFPFRLDPRWINNNTFWVRCFQLVFVEPGIHRFYPCAQQLANTI